MKDLQAKLERHTRLVFEHKPKELHVAVNGNFQGKLKVNSDLNEIVLAVANKEAIEFIEIFSEQQLRLLFLNFENTTHFTTSTTHKLDFSDDRKLRVNVEFVAQGLELKVNYQDPTFKKFQLFLENPQMLDNEIFPMFAPPAKTQKSHSTRNRTLEIFSSFISFFSFKWGRVVLASIFVMVVIGGWMFIDHQPRLSAKAILEEAEKKKLNWQFQPGKVLVWDEEVKRSFKDKSPVEHYRSQHWRSNVTRHSGDLMLRFDDNNQLLWGKWLQEDGTLIIYNGSALGTKIYPGIPLINQKLAGLSSEQKQILRKHLAGSERNLNSERQADMNTSWMLNNYTSQLVKKHQIEGNREALCVTIKSNEEFSDSNVKASQLEVDFDEQTLQRILYSSTIYYDDGSSSNQEVRFLSSREATLDELNNNELVRIIREGKNVKRFTVEEFAEKLRPIYGSVAR